MIRRATLDDAPEIFDLLNKHAGALTMNGFEVEPDALAHHVSDALSRPDTLVLIDRCDGVIVAAGHMTVSPAWWSRRVRVALALWLVSDRPWSGVLVARSLISWAKHQGAVIAFTAKPHLARFYQRLGFEPQETVWVQTWDS